MSLSPEQLVRLQEINAKIQDEYDRDRFSILIAQLMAVFEEKERQDVQRQVA